MCPARAIAPLVVVGASLAGLRAVEGARKSGYTGPITLIGAEKHLPYDRPPLSKAFLDNAEPEETHFRTEQMLAGELGVELVLGAPATRLGTERRVVEVGDSEYPYRALVIATGATARSFPGTEGLSGVHTLRTLDDARAVRSALDAGARTVVVGAGFIGSEVASAARKRGLDVTIVEAFPVPLVRAVGERMGPACSSLHARNGVELRCGIGVSAIEGQGSVERVRLADGTVLDADLVVIGIGATPATDWLAGSGVRVDNGVICDEYLRTSVPDVYAAGDVARWRNSLFGREMRLEHWTSAAEQGAIAARNALGEHPLSAYTTVPYFWSDWYDSRIQFVGVPDEGEVRVVSGDVNDGRFVALYRSGERLAGVLTMNEPREIMKYRRLIAERASWSAALEFAATRARVAVS
ncbi:FAD-dependent oxidoreductase [Nocardia vinacea]|uniref:NAD(P)/FAD-dependent oxidoreductase n=1 Tax=Nocardia vinacea TaxID=96468 RepID=UPI002E15E313|nr:FAD-dependent oxidoreductase [Nocardia vinacea]